MDVMISEVDERPLMNRQLQHAQHVLRNTVRIVESWIGFSKLSVIRSSTNH